MLSYMPTIIDDKGRLKLGSARGYSSTGLFIFLCVTVSRTWTSRLRSRLCYRVASVRLSVVCDVCIVAKRCILVQKVLLTAYRKSYGRNRLAPKWMTLTLV